MKLQLKNQQILNRVKKNYYFNQISRNRIDSAGSDRGHETETGDTGNRETSRRLQVRKSGSIFVGGSGPADQGRDLRQEHGAQRQRHLETSQGKGRGQKIRLEFWKFREFTFFFVLNTRGL